MRVQEFMTKDVELAHAEEPASDAWERMHRYGIHHLVVAAKGSVIGVLSDRDLGGPRGAALRAGHLVAELMTPSAVTAKPDTSLREAANLMRGRTIGCLPVVDRGKVVGIVTTTDLLELIGHGTEKPVVRGKRWTLKNRGPKRSVKRQRTPPPRA